MRRLRGLFTALFFTKYPVREDFAISAYFFNGIARSGNFFLVKLFTLFLLGNLLC